MADKSDVQNELNSIYESIGDGLIEITDDLLQHIQKLEDTLNSPYTSLVFDEEDISHSLCGNPYCNGDYCWECAAIRGGDPMDA